jgi:hypothetical protein
MLIANILSPVSEMKGTKSEKGKRRRRRKGTGDKGRCRLPTICQMSHALSWITATLFFFFFF